MFPVDAAGRCKRTTVFIGPGINFFHKHFCHLEFETGSTSSTVAGHTGSVPHMSPACHSGASGDGASRCVCVYV